MPIRPNKWVEKLAEVGGDVAGAVVDTNKTIASDWYEGKYDPLGFGLGDIVRPTASVLGKIPAMQSPIAVGNEGLLHTGLFAGAGQPKPAQRPRGDAPPNDATSQPLVAAPPGQVQPPRTVSDQQVSQTVQSDDWFLKLSGSEREAAYSDPRQALSIVAQRNGLDPNDEQFQQIATDVEQVSRDFMSAAFNQLGYFPEPEMYYGFLQGYLDVALGGGSTAAQQ